MRQGDYVVRKSYGKDIVFRIQTITLSQAILRGVEMRLLADAPLADLELVQGMDRQSSMFQYQPRWLESLNRGKSRAARTREAKRPEDLQPSMSAQLPDYFELPGKVLHLDGDAEYLKKCMGIYGRLRVPVEGYYVSEPSMSDALHRLLPRVQPDIIVITGHDGLLKHRREGDLSQLSSYKNSHHFVQAVRTARQYEKNRDVLTVVAGACQSHFEALLAAGANFASSPARVLIHALDPLYIACRVAYTPIRETVNILDIVEKTHSGLQGLGGIESRGSYRRGVPKVISNMQSSVDNPIVRLI